MSPIQPAPVFPSAKDEYNRDDEAAFRAQVKAELQRLRAAVDGLPINSVFFSVRDYARPGTTDWKAAFEGADADAVAADGIVLVPPGTYSLSDDVEMLAPIMFAGGLVQPANGKDFETQNTTTALAGEWFDASAGGTVTRPGGSTIPANQENGAVFDGTVILSENTKLRWDGSAAGDTYDHSPSANLRESYAGGNKMFAYNATQMGFFGASPASRQTYTASNVTTDRSYDADAVLIAELADVVGTLIADLRSLGLVA